MITLLILVGLLIFLIFAEIPIAVSLGLAAFVAFLYNDIPLTAMAQRMYSSLDSFPLMAIPFFMLAGSLMEHAGISKKIIRMAQEIVGHFRGGLAQVTILACGIFSALSGSSSATVAAIGSFMYPALIKEKYKDSFATGLIAAGGELGPIIPPSIPMIVIGSITDISIGDLFLGGISVGLFTIIVFMLYAFISAQLNQYGKLTKRPSFITIAKAIFDCLIPLGMPAIILGGIYSGIFTPTEAASVAVFYALVVGLFIYKTIKLSFLPNILIQSAINATLIMFIIASSSAFSWIFARQGCAHLVADWLSPLYSSPLAFLFVSSGIMIVFGMFIEGISFTILLMPIFFPIVKTLGIHPVQFGLITTLCIVIGCLTPPLAVNVYTAASITGVQVTTIMRGVIPFTVCMLFVLVCVIIFPELSIFLPELMK